MAQNKKACSSGLCISRREMTAIVKFTPLYGSRSEGPFCSLLEIDECTLLLDCGWDDKFSPEALEHLRPLLPKIDAVLLSHPDILHLVTVSPVTRGTEYQNNKFI